MQRVIIVFNAPDARRLKPLFWENGITGLQKKSLLKLPTQESPCLCLRPHPNPPLPPPSTSICSTIWASCRSATPPHQPHPRLSRMMTRSLNTIIHQIRPWWFEPAIRWSPLRVGWWSQSFDSSWDSILERSWLTRFAGTQSSSEPPWQWRSSPSRCKTWGNQDCIPVLRMLQRAPNSLSPGFWHRFCLGSRDGRCSSIVIFCIRQTSGSWPSWSTRTTQSCVFTMTTLPLQHAKWMEPCRLAILARTGPPWSFTTVLIPRTRSWLLIWSARNQEHSFTGVLNSLRRKLKVSSLSI